MAVRVCRVRTVTLIQNNLGDGFLVLRLFVMFLSLAVSIPGIPLYVYSKNKQQ